MLKRKKKEDKCVSQKRKISDSCTNDETIKVLYVTQEKIRSGLTTITMMEGSTNSATVIKRENILSFYYYFVLLQGLHSILSACHFLSQTVTTASSLFTE